MTASPENPGGYRPDDPRYGLSGQALLDYYLSRPPEFYVRSLYQPGAAEKRDDAMAPHLAHMAAHRDQLRFAGPLLPEDGTTPLGTMSIINVPDRAAAEAFATGDGFAKAGMLQPPRIMRFISSKRLTQLDREPDATQQMFVCECIDGPDAPALRKQSAAAHHEYQGSIIDKYVAHGPLRSDDGQTLIGSLFIIEAPDRAAALDLVTNEPMTAAGVFSEINIFRWRYGKSLA